MFPNTFLPTIRVSGQLAGAALDPREMSRQIEEWRCTNFADMPDLVARFVGKRVAVEGIELTSLLMRASIDHAIQYAQAPRRTWEDLTPAQEAAVRGLYRDLRVQFTLQEGQRQALGQNAVIVGLLPSLEHAGRARLHTWILADVESIDLGQDPHEDDLRYAKEVRLWHPWQDADGTYTLISLVFNRSEAYYDTPKGKVGVYGTDGLRHPYEGMIPLLGVRTALPTEEGAYLPHPAQDLWAAQVLSVCTGTDVLRQIQVMSPGLQILTGAGVAQFANADKGKGNPQIDRGPENIVLIPLRTTGEDAQATYSYHQTPPATEQYLAAINAYIDQVASTRYLDGPSLRGGQSGNAVMAARADVLAYRLAQEAVWRDAEEALYWLIVGWHNAHDPHQLPTKGPKVQYRYPAPAGSNDLQSAQAQWLRSAMGQVSLVDGLETPGEDLTEAERTARVQSLIAEHLAFVALLNGYVPAGLDSIAKITGLGPKVAP